jgi:hypothetical protein
MRAGGAGRVSHGTGGETSAVGKLSFFLPGVAVTAGFVWRRGEANKDRELLTLVL